MLKGLRWWEAVLHFAGGFIAGVLVLTLLPPPIGGIVFTGIAFGLSVLMGWRAMQYARARRQENDGDTHGSE
jgi:hypothetical protein